MRRSLLVFTVAIGALVVLVLALRGKGPRAVPELSLPVGPATRLLVFAPHPDDEALGAAGLMQRVLAAGGSVRLALMTSGDAFSKGVTATTNNREPTPRDFKDYGDRRQRETIAAMQVLGIDRAQILFLGFPDDGLCLIASRYLSDKTHTFQSPYTRRSEPPAAEQVVPGVTYRGADISREIEAILVAYQPTHVALPHPEDLHPEHCATSIFGWDALDAVAAQHHLNPRVVQYLVHYDGWPDLDGDSNSPLRPPEKFPAGESEWRTFTLTPGEVAVKQRAVSEYRSQLLVMGRFLRAFERPNELFLEGRDTSPPECWCDESHVATSVPPERYRRRPTTRQ